MHTNADGAWLPEQLSILRAAVNMHIALTHVQSACGLCSMEHAWRYCHQRLLTTAAVLLAMPVMLPHPAAAGLPVAACTAVEALHIHCM
jgi:hypothetical protein